MDFGNLLKDINIASLKLKEKHLDISINNQDDLETVLKVMPKGENGLKKLKLILACS
ncbi:189_t:CDS:2 [Racocetra persica]|uniref:189_t:CDS:1 n=1 Tax=Racocetra persica TaxID=160502 RepID=A0ACA9LCD2_9GLOM|nr:189_t:CDS:2 [Racocetra persica]